MVAAPRLSAPFLGKVIPFVQLSSSPEEKMVIGSSVFYAVQPHRTAMR
jgi:hypothetical protein